MKNVLRAIAFGVGLSFAAAAVPTMLAMPLAGVQEQDHHDGGAAQHPDYSKNKFYKTGNEEGYRDYKHKTQRTEHNHKYRNEEDRKAHDYGYQQGLQGQRGVPSDSNMGH